MIDGLPPGLRAWDEAVRYPLRAAPWPYTDAEFAAIQRALPEVGNCEQVHVVILQVARTFVRSRNLPSRRTGKFAPREEIEEVRDVLENIVAACQRLSPPAIEFLQATARSPVPPAIAGLIADARALLNLHGIQHPPPATDRRGRGTDRVLARVVLCCDDIWCALPGGRPRTGFPRFRDAVCLPLGAGIRDAKSWQDILRKGRELRNEAGRKAQDRPD